MNKGSNNCIEGIDYCRSHLRSNYSKKLLEIYLTYEHFYSQHKKNS